MRAMCLSSNVPTDRLITMDELHALLELSILDVPGADVFCRDKTDHLLSPQQQLQHFNARRNPPILDLLMTYLRTRGLKAGSMRHADLLAIVKSKMADESSLGRFMISDPEDGQYEKKRIVLLIRHGILTAVNAPHLVFPPPPSVSDKSWRFITADDLKDLNMLVELLRWEEMFHPSDADHSGRLLKASRRAGARRAYYCRVCRNDDAMLITMRTDRSRVKQAMCVLLIFRMNVGRDVEQEPQLIAAKCPGCDVGENHPGCSHIFSGLTTLTCLQLGAITAGDIGDDGKSWGDPKKIDSVPTQSTANIALLTRYAAVASFTSQV